MCVFFFSICTCPFDLFKARTVAQYESSLDLDRKHPGTLKRRPAHNRLYYYISFFSRIMPLPFYRPFGKSPNSSDGQADPGMNREGTVYVCPAEREEARQKSINCGRHCFAADGQSEIEFTLSGTAGL